MKIGVDIRVLARGIRTGVEEYTINILKRLLEVDPKIEYHLFYNAYKKVKLDYDWLDLDNVYLRDFKIPNRLFFVSSRFLNIPKIDNLLNKIDVYFNPHFFISPLSSQCRKVITFHDLSFEHYPYFFPWRKRIWQKFMNTRKEAQQADRIIAVSQSTKDDLIRLYRIKPSKIKVVYSGVGGQFKPINNQLDYIKNKYHLPDKFILYFGTIEPRKNLIGLIRAFEILKRKHDAKLVIAGVRGWLYQDIFKAVNDSKQKQDIFFTGFIEEQDKPYLYNLAELFVYPSFFEGFGFPPLEAMACGVPTITSFNSSLPEIVGSAGIMIDPYNIDELAGAMEMVLNNIDLRERLVKRGIEQAKKFSWDQCAQQTLDVLRE